MSGFFVLFFPIPLMWALGIELGSSCSQRKPLQTEPWRQSLVYPPVREAIGGEVLLILSSRTGPRRGVSPLGPGPCLHDSNAQLVTQIDLSAEPQASQAEALCSALWEKQRRKEWKETQYWKRSMSPISQAFHWEPKQDIPGPQEPQPAWPL